MYVTAIVLAAGRGIRFKSKISKPLIEINFQPIIIYCLNVFSKHPHIRDIIVAVNGKNSKSVINKIKRYRIKKIKNIVLGGRERSSSVACGLKAMDSRTDLVLIHDAVRPFIDKDSVSRVIKEADKYGAAIVGVPVKATIKKAARRSPLAARRVIVEKTLDRERLWEIQTPQVFKKDLILEAYKRFGNTVATDDASLVEKSGAKVRLIPGSCFNIKVTTPEDLVLAEAILRAKSVKRKTQN